MSALAALVAFVAVAQLSTQPQIPVIPQDPEVRTGQLENGMKYYIRTYTDAQTPNIITVNNSKGVVIDTLADRRAAVAAAGALARKEFKQFITERGDTLNYYIQFPENYDPAKLYPVLLTQYSGPGSQSVRNRWVPIGRMH